MVTGQKTISETKLSSLNEQVAVNEANLLKTQLNSALEMADCMIISLLI